MTLTETCPYDIYLRSSCSGGLSSSPFPHFQMPRRPHRRTNVRKSEIRDDRAFSRWDIMRSLGLGISDASIRTVVFGGSEMAFSIICRAALWSWRSEMEERTVEERRLV